MIFVIKCFDVAKMDIHDATLRATYRQLRIWLNAQNIDWYRLKIKILINTNYTNDNIVNSVVLNAYEKKALTRALLDFESLTSNAH